MDLKQVVSKVGKFLASKAFAYMLIVGIIILLLWLGYDYQHELAEDMLQGYWHIAGNLYLLIDGKVLQFIVFSSDTQSVIYKDTNAAISSGTFLTNNIFEFNVIRSKSNIIDLSAWTNTKITDKELTFKLYPAFGTISVFNKKKQLIQMTKDNSMSITHFAH